MLFGCRDKFTEKRMRVHGAGFEFRVELAAQKPGMVGQFHYLHKVSVRRGAAENHAFFRQSFLKFIIEFIAVAVAFFNQFFFVGLKRAGIGQNLARV